MAIEQLPSANAFAVGGTTSVANHVVGQEVDGFEESGESKMNAAGQHLVDIVYSRRATKSLTLELANGGSAALYVSGGSVDASFSPSGTPKVWEIRSATVTKTRGPTQIALELVSLTESITAP